jgi:hypothetical protein
LYNTIGIKKEFKNKKTKLDKDNKENTGKRPYNRKNTEVIDIAKQNEGIFNAKLGEFISEAVRLHLENLKPEPKVLIENIITSKYGIMSGERLYNFLLKLADYIEKDIEYDITIKIKEALPEPIEIPTQTALPQTTTTGNASYASISYQTTNTSAQVQSIVTNKTEQKPYSLKVEG